MYYLLIAAAIWAFPGCGEDGKGAPTKAEDNAQASAVFADTSLEAAVRQALRKPVGALRDADLAGLNELEARGRGIVSLQGIGQLKNLTALDLADNQIRDITPLAALLQLKFLDLDNNQVIDLSPLAGLSQLESVILDRNRIKDLSPLLGLIELSNVEVSGNPLSVKAVNDQLLALQNQGVQVAFRPGESLESPGALPDGSGFRYEA